MGKNRIVTLLFILLSASLYGQPFNYWLPSFYLNTTNICDNTPYKLVFYDEFDGNTLSNKWQTFVSWDGMPGGDNSNWSKARWDNDNAIFKDDNVFVSNGTCKIQLKNEHYSWKCDSCPESERLTTNLTGGIIATPYYFNGNKNSYNSGKFEARIKFPVFKGAWSCFWLWHGAPVNEIDIAEAWGGNNPNIPWQGSDRRRNTYSTHAWGPKYDSVNPEPNPYWLEWGADKPSTEVKFPDQEWWKFIFGTHHKQQDWHIYTCEWDSARIKTYLDYNLVGTLWKYYQDRAIEGWEYKNGSFQNVTYIVRVGSSCNPDNGLWNVTYGFPYNSKSESQMRLSTGASDYLSGDAAAGTFTLGTMEVDYVKAWQRHPEEDGHTDLCAYNGPIPTLSGSAQVCSNGTVFTVNPVVPGGSWDWGSQLSLMSSTANTRKLFNNTYSSYYSSYVRYHYGPSIPGCPVRYVERQVYCTENPHNNPRPHGPIVLVNTKFNADMHRFHFFVGENYPMLEDGTKTQPGFEWEVKFINPSTGLISQSYAAQGQFISIPFPTVNGDDKYYLTWKLKTTNSDGSVTINEGIRTEKSPLYQQADSNVNYYDAIVVADSYEQKVSERIAGIMVSEEEFQDSLGIMNLFEKIRAEELDPYIILDSTHLIQSSFNRLGNEVTESKLYPNPVQDKLYIELGSQFNKSTTTTIEVYSMPGRLIKAEARAGSAISIDTKGLAEGNYILTLRQDGHRENHKFIKTGSE